MPTKHKSLKFAMEFVDLVLSGKKTTTWRLFDDKDLQKGDKIGLINKNTDEEFAKAKILDVKEKKLDELTNEDMIGQIDFGSQAMICHQMSKMYNREVTVDTPVKVITFKVIDK